MTIRYLKLTTAIIYHLQKRGVHQYACHLLLPIPLGLLEIHESYDIRQIVAREQRGIPILYEKERSFISRELIIQ